MRWVPGLKSFNLIDFMNLGVVRRRFAGGSGMLQVWWVRVGRVFGSFFGRPEGFGSSEFSQVVDLLMLYRFIWVSGADIIKNIDCLTKEGSNFEDLGKDK